MTKVKQGLKTLNHSPVEDLKTVKKNSIQKKKKNKFVNTPTGKVRLVNGKKVQNNDTMENKLNNKQKEEKEIIKDSPDSPDTNCSSPRSIDKDTFPKKVLNSKKALNSPNGSSGKNKRTIVKNLGDNEDDSDESIEDINEGIILPEDSIVSQDDNDDDDNETDEEESEVKLPNILGQSLADDTDEDDSDFKEEEDDEDGDEHDSDEDGNSKLKGVKMFKGLLKQKLDSVGKNDDDDDYDDDDEDEDEDEDEDDEGDDSNDDDYMDKSNLETDTSKASGTNEEEDDKDSEEDEDDEDDDEEDSAPGLKDLLGNSIVDDDESDEDFEGEDEDDEDIDISDEELEAEAKELEEEKRTIYVGNVPKGTKVEEVKKLFKVFGGIKSIRIRNVAPVNENISKKVAAITQQIHKNIDHVCMLVVFKNEESVLKALSMNGTKFKGNYLRVDSVGNNSEKPDPKKAVFLGNLPFKTLDNDIWEHFKQCGPIESVRIIRDKKTRIGKGIGYVNFKSEVSVPLALELNGSTILNREIRVKRCTEQKSVSKSENESQNNKNKRSLPTDNKVKKSAKKLRVNDEDKTTSSVVDGKKKLKTKGKLEDNSSPTSVKKKTIFQGQKATVGKKAKQSKLDKKKKKIAAILISKVKKGQKL